MHKKNIFLAIAIFCLAINLRAIFLAVTPLLKDIGTIYSLDSSTLGLLTTIPLLVFAFASSAMGPLGNKYGVGRVIVLSLVLIILGEILRYYMGREGLFIGTFFIALGIVAGNVLIPAIISAFFPKSISIMTSTYTTLMQVGTSVSLATIGPLAMLYGVNNALAIWCWPTILAFVFWVPLFKLDIKSGNQEKNQIKVSISSVFKHELAWFVSLFMGIQSLTYFSLSTWLPLILSDKGIPKTEMGLYMAMFQGISLLATFILPLYLKRFNDQRYFAVGLSIFYIFGVIVTQFISNSFLAWLAIVILGISAGGIFVLAMLFFILRTNLPQQAAILSGVGQAIGYVVAAIMPVAIGKLYDTYKSWETSLIVLAIWMLLSAFVGYHAGKNKKIPL